MFSRFPLLTAAAGLLSVATALPAYSGSSLSARDDTQCPVGTAYYVCYINDFRGCCSVDPCAMKEGCPDNKPQPEEPETCQPGKKTQVFQPKMKTLQEGKPPVSTPNFHILKSATEEQQQTMAFDLPQEAKECTLTWVVPEKSKRTFRAGSNALVDVYSVGENAERVGQAEFSFWPDLEEGHEAVVGSMDCQQARNLRVELVKNDEVYIEQNSYTGWAIEYTC
ncbi:uncharacterized protein BDW47DRAFT_109549 [Aspergillus candidus]|uniref:Ubiquitin 3 binding protein But2 C-terminal domain-containing protein n=1 Tax=Aspergillus candidus TaxID=41067 RepID=A0A2I2F5X5_ASPCN|nr:hypothetical protein BDW47DRAFT_109549 [Aspergillus candidus]PLB35978.1 hypothetical protein BDW47DRAFT_109549 [Aspergillus candidus]